MNCTIIVDRPRQGPPPDFNASIDQLGCAKNLAGVPGITVPSWGVTVWIPVRRLAAVHGPGERPTLLERAPDETSSGPLTQSPSGNQSPT